MVRLSGYSTAVRVISSLSLVAGCAPAPTHTTANGWTTAAKVPASSDGTVVIGATASSSSATHAGVVVTAGVTPKPVVPAVEVKAPVISNNGASTIHGSVLVPPSILSNNGAGIVSPNGGTIVSPNGGTIVSPNGGTIVSPNGGTIVSPNGGTIVSPNGGTIVANNGAGFKLSQIPLRYAEVQLTDASGSPVRDSDGNQLLTKTDGNGNYSFPVDVKGRNLIVRAAVPGQTESLLGLLPRSGGDASAIVDMNSTVSLSYILERYVDQDLARFERLDTDSFSNAVTQTDAALSTGLVPLPRNLSVSELSAKVDQIRLKSKSADGAFEDIRKLLIPVGVTNNGDGLKGTEVNFGQLDGGALSNDGTTYFFSHQLHSLWKLSPDGIVHSLVPKGGWGYREQALDSNQPIVAGMAVNKDGYIFVADSFNHRIVRVSPQNEAIIVAGTGEPGFDGDGGPAINAKLNLPTGLLVDNAGSIIFSDNRNNRIRKVTPDGNIVTIVGDGNSGEEFDEKVPGGTRLNDAQGIALCSDGRLLVADGNHHRVLEFSNSGHVGRVINDPIQLAHPESVLVEGNSIYILDSQSARPFVIQNGLNPATNWFSSLSKIISFPVDTSSNSIFVSDGRSSLVSESSSQFLLLGSFETEFKEIFGVNRQDAYNLLDRVSGLTIDSDGSLIVVDQPGGRVFRQRIGGILTPIAGVKDGHNNVEGPVPLNHDNALEAGLQFPRSVSIDPKTGELLIVVSGDSSSIRRLTKSGKLIVERRDFPYQAKQIDGTIATKQVIPGELVISKGGITYLSGLDGPIVRINTTGMLELMPGTNQVKSVRGLFFDSNDRLYFLDAADHLVYRVQDDGLVPSLDVDAAFRGKFGNYSPESVVIDQYGNYYATEGFHVCKYYPATHRVVDVAGQGGMYFSGESRDSSLRVVTRLVLSQTGDLYLLDRDQVKLLTADQLMRLP